MSLRTEKREILSVLLPFVSLYASHLYCNTPPICIAVLLGDLWWLWSPGCSLTHAQDPDSTPTRRCLLIFHLFLGARCELGGPLNWLNSRLSLLRPFDRCRTTPLRWGGPISPYLAPGTGSSQPPRSKPLGGLQPRDSGAIVSKPPQEQARNK